ncbi:MAG: clan AA aspartic protease [Blastocatellia bacterium]|nr:clan AA aspartic protease [Blastocatellia bacterium]
MRQIHSFLLASLMVVSATVARAQPVHDAIDVPFDLNANHIYLRATVNGSRPLWFLLDTGAEMSVVDSTVAASVGLTSVGSATARGSGEGTMKAGFAQGVTLAVGRAVAKGQTVVTLPLDALEPIDGRSIDGILGHDFIASFVVTIDYSQRRVSFRDPARFDSATIPAGERVPIEIVGGIPRIHGTVVLPGAETIDGVFTVDTGSRTALSLNTPFVRENALVNRIAESSLDAPYGFGIGGATKTRVGRIDAFRIGVVKFEKPVIGFSFGEKGVDASSSIAGNIGGELMRRFRVTFDYGRKVMVLEPNVSVSLCAKRLERASHTETQRHGVSGCDEPRPHLPAGFCRRTEAPLHHFSGPRVRQRCAHRQPVPRLRDLHALEQESLVVILHLHSSQELRESQLSRHDRTRVRVVAEANSGQRAQRFGLVQRQGERAQGRQRSECLLVADLLHEVDGRLVDQSIS